MVEYGHIMTLSVFALLSTSELAFYLDNGPPLASVLGAAPDGGVILEDVFVDRDGDVVSLVQRPSGANGARAPRRAAAT